MLKLGKKEGNINFSSDHAVNTSHDFLTYVARLFSYIIKHSVIVDGFLTCTIVLIPKGRNASVSDSANYSGITLSRIAENFLMI
jgi:hypothetical protein